MLGKRFRFQIIEPWQMTSFPVRRSWIWGGAVILCALAGGVWWWVASLPEKSEDPFVAAAMRALDEELASTRLYRLWKEKYPADYQAFLQERVTKPSGDDSDSLMPQSMVWIQRYLPYADNKSLIRFVAFTERQYKAIQAISPIQCALYAIGDPEFDKRLLRYIEKDDSGLSPAILSDILIAVVTSSDLRRSIPSEARIAPVKMKIRKMTGLDVRTSLQEGQGGGEDERICQASIASSKAILELPEDEAAGFLRYAFHAAFVVPKDRADAEP